MPEPKLVYSHQATGDNPPGHRQAKAGGQALLSPESSTESPGATADMRGTHASVHVCRVMVKWSAGPGPGWEVTKGQYAAGAVPLDAPLHIQH